MKVPLGRWALHRIRRALARAVEAERPLQNSAEADPQRRAKSKREMALWQELDFKLERMLEATQRKK